MTLLNYIALRKNDKTALSKEQRGIFTLVLFIEAIAFLAMSIEVGQFIARMISYFV